jgi:MFS family permease
VAARVPLPRTFWFLFAGQIINRVGSFVVPLYAIYLTGERGLSPTTAGWVIACYGAGSLLSGPLGGALADALGRRPTMLIGFCWGAGAMLLVPLVDGTLPLAAATFHLGLASDTYRPAVQAAVADLCGPTERPRAFGLLYWAVNLGFAIATAVGGALAHAGFGRLFVADAATTLCFAGLIALFVPETRPAAAAREVEALHDEGGLGEVVRDRVLIAFLLTQCLVGVQFLQSQGALPVALGARGITRRAMAPSSRSTGSSSSCCSRSRSDGCRASAAPVRSRSVRS